MNEMTKRDLRRLGLDWTIKEIEREERLRDEADEFNELLIDREIEEYFCEKEELGRN